MLLQRVIVEQSVTVVGQDMQIHLMWKIQHLVLMAPARGEIHVKDVNSQQFA